MAETLDDQSIQVLLAALRPFAEVGIARRTSGGEVMATIPDVAIDTAATVYSKFVEKYPKILSEKE